MTYHHSMKKRTPRKTTLKKAPLKVSTKYKRGQNAKSIEFSERTKDPENIMKTLDAFNWGTFDYLRRKDKPNGRNYRPPQGLIVTFKFIRGGNYFFHSVVTPKDFVVNKQSIEQFIKDSLQDLIDIDEQFEEGIEDDTNEPEGEVKTYNDPTGINPAKLVSIIVRFIYSKNND